MSVLAGHSACSLDKDQTNSSGGRFSRWMQVFLKFLKLRCLAKDDMKLLINVIAGQFFDLC